MRSWAPDGFWQAAQPLIPVPPPRRQGGGKRRADDRAVLAALVYLVRAGCWWGQLPAGLVGVSRATAHRRCIEWTTAGLGERLHQQFLHRRGVRGEIDWSRAVVETPSRSGPTKGGPHRAEPGNRGKLGSKIHVLCDRHGLPLTVLTSAASTHDSQLLLPLLDSIALIRSPAGRPPTRPAKLHADKGLQQAGRPRCVLSPAEHEVEADT